MMFNFTKEKMFLAEHLSLMIKGGTPLSEALKTLKKEAKPRTFRKALDDILKGVVAGESLARGLERHPKIFDKFFCAVVRVGEESGTLEENLKYLAEQLRKDFEMRKKVRGALIYPSLVVAMALGIAFTISFFILPKITELFRLLEIELPLTTRILITSTSFFQKNWLFIVGGLIFFLFVFKMALALKFIRFYFDKTSLSFPFLASIFQNLNLARFSRTFYTLLKSGMPMLDVLALCAETLPNEVYKKNLILVRSRVEQGEKVSQGLKEFPRAFPSVFSQMIMVGERSGTLEESLLYLAEFHEKEVDRTLKNLSGLLEPILLILIGVFVAFVAIAIITPIYRFTGQLRFR